MNSKELKVKRINKDAVLPSYAHEGDAGLDLFSVEEKILRPFETSLIATGLQIELPLNTEAQIRPRSGLALKHNITILNTPGTIDQGYRGEVKIILSNFGKEDFVVKKGMKIAQMVIMPVLTVKTIEVDILNDSSRGEGGFGSTGV